MTLRSPTDGTSRFKNATRFELRTEIATIDRRSVIVRGALESMPLLPMALLITTLLTTGCATYQFGTRSLYRSDIRTVHVPIFTSNGLRRNVGERLTEAVVKEIELRTPYKVVATPNADSLLTGRIVQSAKRVLTENGNDEARSLEVDLAVRVDWVDHRGAAMMQDIVVPVSPLALTVGRSATFVPEAGQSYATAELTAIRKAAADIVSNMEMRW